MAALLAVSRPLYWSLILDVILPVRGAAWPWFAVKYLSRDANDPPAAVGPLPDGPEVPPPPTVGTAEEGDRRTAPPPPPVGEIGPCPLVGWFVLSSSLSGMFETKGIFI